MLRTAAAPSNHVAAWQRQRLSTTCAREGRRQPGRSLPRPPTGLFGAEDHGWSILFRGRANGACARPAAGDRSDQQVVGPPAVAVDEARLAEVRHEPPPERGRRARGAGGEARADQRAVQPVHLRQGPPYQGAENGEGAPLFQCSLAGWSGHAVGRWSDADGPMLRQTSISHQSSIINRLSINHQSSIINHQSPIIGVYNWLSTRVLVDASGCYRGP